MSKHGPTPAPELEVVDLAAGMSHDVFRAACALRQRIDEHDDPLVPPTPTAEMRALMDDRTNNAQHHRYVAVADDAAVALGHLELPHGDENGHLAMVEIEVDPNIDPATRVPLLGHLIHAATDAGRTSLLLFGHRPGEEDAEWVALGFTRRQIVRVSIIDLASVDASTMEAWIDEGRRRNSDIELVRWRGACPDQYLDAFAATRTAMNDAPLDDVEWNDEEWTAELVRADEGAMRDVGVEWWNLMAVDPGGAPVAMTGVLVNTNRPGASWQHDTVVLAEFRGRRIGRWVKAEMWRWLRHDAPDVDRLRTDNAESNDHMLAINVAMGYRPYSAIALWQADIDEITIDR